MENPNSDGDFPHLTDCGIPGIEKIPYGIHLCHFYRDRQELADALLSYFEAGIRNNERCIWITADPLPARQAREEFTRRYPGLGRVPAAQLTISDYIDWYPEESGNPAEVLQAWLQEERRALADGFRGLRVTGNASFLTQGSWPAFMEYEHSVTHAIGGSRIIALCSYSTACTVERTLDVMCTHQFTLDRQLARWQLVEPLPPARI